MKSPGQCAPLLITLLAVASPLLHSQDAKQDKSVEVRVSYTGSGTVDEKHKIYVAMWDSPDFMSGAIPIELQPVTSKNGKATFAHINASTVYFSTVFDPTGQWEAQSMPPSGSAVGLYSKEPGKPEPVKVEAGKSNSIELSFDDANKIP